MEFFNWEMTKLLSMLRMGITLDRGVVSHQNGRNAIEREAWLCHPSSKYRNFSLGRRLKLTLDLSVRPRRG